MWNRNSLQLDDFANPVKEAAWGSNRQFTKHSPTFIDAHVSKKFIANESKIAYFNTGLQEVDDYYQMDLGVN
jgi:hypothetical protein